MGAASRVIRDFRYTILAVLAILGICALVQTAITLGLVTLEQLDVSRANPVGIVTAVFSHYDWSLLGNNGSTLSFYSGLFIISNASREAADRVSRGCWFAVALLPIAFAVNLTYILLSPGASRGASGAVMAGLGILIGFGFLNTVDGLRVLHGGPVLGRSEQETQQEGTRAIGEFVINGSFLFGIATGMLLYPRILLGLGDPSVNVFAHVLALGIGGWTAWFWHVTHKTVSRRTV